MPKNHRSRLIARKNERNINMTRSYVEGARPADLMEQYGISMVRFWYLIKRELQDPESGVRFHSALECLETLARFTQGLILRQDDTRYFATVLKEYASSGMFKGKPTFILFKKKNQPATWLLWDTHQSPEEAEISFHALR